MGDNERSANVLQHLCVFTASVVVLLFLLPQPGPTGIVQNLFTTSNKQLLWN